MKKNLTRKDFLVNASKAAVGVTAVAGVSNLITTATAKANVKTPWPWPYQQLDVANVRIKAHDLYYNGMACCAGVFGGLVQELVSVVGDPWTGLPPEIMQYGGGGANSWGILCGAINGGLALISLVVDKTQSSPLLTELLGWYTQAELPTDTANQFAQNGQYTVHNFDDVLPQNVSGSPLCHVSVTEWCNFADKKVSSSERKERCARIAGDCAAKVAEILNAFFAGSFTATYADPASVTECLGCHGSAFMYNVMTKMECVQCHGDNPHPDNVEKLSPGASSFKLSQNYPNPFNPSTKIQFSVPETEKVKLEVYDIRGRLIKTLVDYNLYQPGSYQVDWNGQDNNGMSVSSGVYFAKMTAGKFSQTRKMSLVK